MASYGGSMKKKILIKGPLLTRSGYGEQSRFALRSLNMDEERVWIDNTIEKTIAFAQQGGTFDMSLQITIPNEFQRLAPVNIGYTAGIETTKIAHQWIPKCNEMDKIITISSFSKQSFDLTEYEATNNDTGEQVLLKTLTPVDFVNYPVKHFQSLPELDLNITTKFNFLVVAQHVFNRINSMISNYSEDKKCKVYLLHGDMSDEEIHSLYNHPKIDAFVSLAHGEGFGLPIFEAAYSALPVVATGWSGQLDFLVDENGDDQFYSVSFDLGHIQPEVVWEGVLIKESMWSYPREASAKQKMRLCYEDVTNNISRWDNSQITSRFEDKKQYKKFVDSVLGFDSSLIEIQTNIPEDQEVVEFE